MFGFLSYDSKDLGLRNREAYIVPDAQEHCAWAAALFDDKGSTFVFDPAKKFAKICSRVQGSDDNPIIHKLSGEELLADGRGLIHRSSAASRRDP